MNQGYLFLIIMWLLVILVFTHWADFLWKDHHNVKRVRRHMLLLLLSVIMLKSVYIPISIMDRQLLFNLGSLLIPGLVALYLMLRDKAGFRLQMVTVVTFLGLFYGVIYELLFMDPILMIIPLLYMIPAFIVLFIVLSTNQLHLQLYMLFAGFALGEVVHKLFLLKHHQSLYFGDALYRDKLMMGLVMTLALWFIIRLLSVCYDKCAQILASFARKRAND
jgi:hypothetical protein